MKSKAPQLHLEYRFYKTLGQAGEYQVTPKFKISMFDFNLILK